MDIGVPEKVHLEMVLKKERGRQQCINVGRSSSKPVYGTAKEKPDGLLRKQEVLRR